jgi:hypothetical protein
MDDDGSLRSLLAVILARLREDRLHDDERLADDRDALLVTVLGEREAPVGDEGRLVVGRFKVERSSKR